MKVRASRHKAKASFSHVFLFLLPLEDVAQIYSGSFYLKTSKFTVLQIYKFFTNFTSFTNFTNLQILIHFTCSQVDMISHHINDNE